MKRWFIPLLCIVGLALPLINVRAQTPLEIDQLQVDIWPEYDQPSALVIYHLTLSANSTLPAQVSLRIPREADGPANVANKDVDGMLYNLTYDQAVVGDWIKVSFTAPSKEIQVEYYDPRLIKNGNNRQYTFHWPGDYRVRSMSLRIQKPINAANLLLTKSNLTMDSGTQGTDGLVYYIVPIDGVVETGQNFDVQFSYTKPDSVLSSTSASSVQPQKTVTGSAALGASLAPTLNMIWIGLGAGIALVVIGVFWYISQQRMNAAATSSRKRHASTNLPKSRVVQEGMGDAVYCFQCGKRAGTADTFCRACGTKLRV